MKLIYKHLGQTPLETLEQFRAENPALKDETLSYIGRLDPMAEGEMIVLVGKAENQNRQQYSSFDKEYVAEFLVGFSTDTGDLLGLVQKRAENIETAKVAAVTEKVEETATAAKTAENLLAKIKLLPQKLLQIKNQKFPWFSSKHVLGRALFDWFKAGQGQEIERPSKNIEIYSATLMKNSDGVIEDSENKNRSKADFLRTISLPDFQNYLTENINKVTGDFRQPAILAKWRGILDDFKMSAPNSPVLNSNFPASNSPTLTPNTSAAEFPIFTLKLKVSTGTYIRGLTEEIEKIIGRPVVLFSLKRPKIFLNN